MHNQKGLSAIALLLVLILLLALAGVGFFYYKQKQAKSTPPSTTFEHFNLSEDVVLFLFQRIPRLYVKTFQLNTELTLIESELDRITELENEYPSGKRIVESERALWIKLQKNLLNTVQSSEKTIESYYVAYMVNPEKGKQSINDSLEDLMSQMETVLNQSRTETKRLKVVTTKTAMEKLKDLF